MSASWRGPSELETRVDGKEDRLNFGSLLTVNFRGFADAGRLAPRWRWAKGTRISVNALNLLDQRQVVRDLSGATPLQYQPDYRDPLGRTVELELRRTF